MKPIYYICHYCDHKNSINTFWKWFSTPHFGSKKWIKCECCKKYHAMERLNYKHKWLDWYR